MEKEIVIKNINFNLKHTFESAQPLAFYGDYYESKNLLNYIYKSSVIYVNNIRNNELIAGWQIKNDNEDLNKEILKRFRLFENINYIYSQINTDENIKSAINRYNGMHLTINDLWETALCFIISQFNNVKRIRGIVKNIINRYGTKIDETHISFPTLEDMNKATKEDLIKCGAGFRAEYVINAIDYFTNNVDLNKLNPNDYYNLHSTLTDVKGIGDKVADCIILMGYGNLEAFPIDVWVKRQLEKLYFNGEKQKIDKLQDFAWERWGKYRGYAQQYLFHAGRKSE
ncbi:MAG: DNA-3-methyladenine glycosylase family protein [Candidatus Micrarchaeia archaeon]